MNVRSAAGVLLLAVSVLPAGADDWTTTDGKTYQGVKVLSHDSAFVTILDSDGGARVPLRTLNADLQKRFGYDAAKAAAAEAAEIARDRSDRQAVLAEEQAARKAAATPPPPPPVNNAAPAPAPAGTASSPPAAAASAPANNGKTPLTDDQRNDIQKQLDDLRADLAFLVKEDAKSSGLRTEGGVSHGAYADKIRAEEDQINTLQRELTEGYAE